MTNTRVLLIDDDEPFRQRLARAFVDRGYVVETAGSGEELRKKVPAFLPTHTVIDLRLASESGLDFVEALSSQSKVVMLTGYGSVPTALEAVRRGATNYLAKPVSFPDLEAALFGPALAPTSSMDHAHVPSLDDVEWEHIQRVLRDCE
ncbi:MAG: response regulator, partial [Deltaproteobacteria bacterium]|nr:response regulator [Deltaproteobacteria bacterium]